MCIFSILLFNTYLNQIFLKHTFCFYINYKNVKIHKNNCNNIYQCLISPHPWDCLANFPSLIVVQSLFCPNLLLCIAIIESHFLESTKFPLIDEKQYYFLSFESNFAIGPPVFAHETLDRLHVWQNLKNRNFIVM